MLSISISSHWPVQCPIFTCTDIFWIYASNFLSNHLLQLDEVHIYSIKLSPLATWLSNMYRTNWTLSYMFFVRNKFFFLPYFNTALSPSPKAVASCTAVRLCPVKTKQYFYLNIWIYFKNYSACGYYLCVSRNYLTLLSNWFVVLK